MDSEQESPKRQGSKMFAEEKNESAARHEEKGKQVYIDYSRSIQ